MTKCQEACLKITGVCLHCPVAEIHARRWREAFAGRGQADSPCQHRCGQARDPARDGRGGEAGPAASKGGHRQVQDEGVAQCAARRDAYSLQCEVRPHRAADPLQRSTEPRADWPKQHALYCPNGIHYTRYWRSVLDFEVWMLGNFSWEEKNQAFLCNGCKEEKLQPRYRVDENA
jgi:hypothetical protein